MKNYNLLHECLTTISTPDIGERPQSLLMNEHVIKCLMKSLREHLDESMPINVMIDQDGNIIMQLDHTDSAIRCNISGAQGMILTIEHAEFRVKSNGPDWVRINCSRTYDMCPPVRQPVVCGRIEAWLNGEVSADNPYRTMRMIEAEKDPVRELSKLASLPRFLGLLQRYESLEQELKELEAV